MKKDQTQEVLIFEMEKKTGEKKKSRATCWIRQAEWEEQWPRFQKTLSNSAGTSSALGNRSCSVLLLSNLPKSVYVCVFFTLSSFDLAYLSNPFAISCCYLLVAIFFCFSFRSSVHVYVCVFMHSCRQSEKLCHAALLGGSTVPDCCLKHTRTSHSIQTLLPGSTPLCLSVTVTHAQTKMCKTECQNLSTNNTSTQVHRICFVFAVIQIFISTEVVWLPWCRL